MHALLMFAISMYSVLTNAIHFYTISASMRYVLCMHVHRMHVRHKYARRIYVSRKNVHYKHLSIYIASRVGRGTLKMLPRKSKTQFLKQEHNTQNVIALLNYLKHIALQQLMLRTQVFTKKLKMQRTRPQLF